MQTALWTIEIRQLATRLRCAAASGVAADLLPVCVDITIGACTAAQPQVIEDCLNYQPICRWLLDDWPLRPAAPDLETRLLELLDFIFGFDQRVSWADVSLTCCNAVLRRRRQRQQLRPLHIDAPPPAGLRSPPAIHA